MALTLPLSLAPGPLGFILYSFSHSPPTLLLFISSRLFSFSVLFVTPKRFPRPAVGWPGAALGRATSLCGAEVAESPQGIASVSL